MKDLVQVVGGLLFSADGPLTAAQIAEVVPEASAADIEAAIEELRVRLAGGGHGFSLVTAGDGHQFLTRAEVAPWVERFLVGRRRQRLSRAALEVLSIIAYRQPITRGDVEDIRGVDCGGVMHTLLERKLAAVRGRARRLGHPLLYVTTDRFLEHFGIPDLTALPKLEEFRALFDRSTAQAELRAQGVLPLAPESAVPADASRPAAELAVLAEEAVPAADLERQAEEAETVVTSESLLSETAALVSADEEAWEPAP